MDSNYVMIVALGIVSIKLIFEQEKTKKLNARVKELEDEILNLTKRATE